jgi:hypothetical protein
MDFRPMPKPLKRDRPNLKLRREIKKKDREWQEEVPKEGNCFNCRFWKPLVGDHIKKRRYLSTRHEASNRRIVCAECNGDFESLSAKQLIQKYPLSPLQEEWKTRTP